MWDRHYDWYIARQSYRDQRRASRQAYRVARRNYRYRRGRVPFFAILFIILVASGALHIDVLAMLFLLVIIGSIIFMLIRNGMYHASGLSNSSTNYQQPNQYYQPTQQPNQYYQPSQQPNQYYQPPASTQAEAPYSAPYQSYEQGYQSPHSESQQGAQPYQGNPSVSTSEQYEEPLPQYPQEMPPMV